MVLLVVDTQKAIINSRLYQFDLFESHVKKLIDKVRDIRDNGIEVIFVRHDDGVGNELTKGNNGFEVYERFQPKDNEIIFDKNVNSSFKDTGLLEYLNKKEEKTIIEITSKFARKKSKNRELAELSCSCFQLFRRREQSCSSGTMGQEQLLGEICTNCFLKYEPYYVR